MDYDYKALQQKVDAALYTLQSRFSFWGPCVYWTNAEIFDGKQFRAATDGKKILFDAKFVEESSQALINGVTVHEMEHILRMHHLRMGSREPEVWNLACDTIINADLEEYFASYPAYFEIKDYYNLECFERDSGKKIDDLSQYTEEELYDILMEKLDQDAQADGYDSYSDMKEKVGQSILDKIKEAMDRLDQPESAEQGEGSMSEEQRQIEALINECVEAEKFQAGSVPGHYTDYIDKREEPKVHWQDKLRQFLTQSFQKEHSWKNFEKRTLYRDLYLPRVNPKEAIGELGIALDGSGSMYGQFQNCIDEIAGLVREVTPDVIHSMQFDTDVHHYEKLEAVEDFPIVEGAQWGGTAFDPIFNFVKEKDIDQEMTALLIFTDGYASFSADQPSYPVMAVVTEDGTEEYFPDWVEVIRIPPEK